MSSKIFVWNISYHKKNSARCYHKCQRSSCKMLVIFVNFNETWIFFTDFQKYSYIKFHENPSSGSRVVPCGWTERQTDGWMDEYTAVTKLIVLKVPFWNFASASKNYRLSANVNRSVAVDCVTMLCFTRDHKFILV